MKDKQLKQWITQWVVPFLLLVILMGILVVNFSAKSRMTGKTNVEDALKAVAEKYAIKVQSELEKMTASGLPMADFLSFYSKDDIKEGSEIAYALQGNTVAYQVILCNTDGMGLAHDQSEKWVDLTKTDYFEEVSQIEKQAYFYTENDGYMGEEAIVSAIPVWKEQEIRGYMLLYYKCSEFEKLIRIAEFDSEAFYAVVANDGTVICSSGKVTSPLYSDKDFYGNLESRGDNAQAVESIRKWIRTRASGVEYVSSDTESRGIVLAPMEMNNWYMVIGINESYINLLETRAWKDAKIMLIQLLVAMVVFVGALLVGYIFARVRNRETSRVLEDKADTDLLTELNNKIATERKIKEYLLEHPDEQAMMFVLDIDNFKKINDTKGHVFGDEVLRTLGMRIKGEFRVSDIIGRTGGDEFTIFLKNIKDDDLILKEGKRVENFFRNFQAGDYVKYSVTASIGAAVYPRDAKDFEELYKAADHALYLAKRRGKNQLAFYGSEKEN